MLVKAGTSPDAFVAELGALATAGKLPARLDSKRLFVYTPAWKATLYPTSYGDAYNLGHVAPLMFKDQVQLVQQALLIGTTATWYAYPHIRNVPQGFSAYWQQLTAAWARQTQPDPPSAAIPAHHSEYLDLLTEVVEATRDIEVARQEEAPALPYRRVDTTREQRHSARGTYVFHLVGSAELPNGTMVFLPDRPELRGRVLRVKDRELTIRFETAADFRLIPPQGTLKQLPSDRVFQAQLNAVETLRMQESAHPRMLSWFVDRQLAAYQPDLEAKPLASLDNDQLRAFAYALSTPDLALVLGPPGTGKTRTITEIATAAVARGQRVLVTSQTNRAVDNVLERLPDHIRAIRAGNEDAMTTRARGYMAEYQVERLRDQILHDTEGTFQRLTTAAGIDSQADRWLDHSSKELQAATTAAADAEKHTEKLSAAIVRATAPIAAELKTANHNLEVMASNLARITDRQRLTEQKLSSARQRASGPVGFWFAWLASRRIRTLAQVTTQLAETRSLHTAACQTYDSVKTKADQLVAADSQVAALRRSKSTALGVRDESVTQAVKSIQMVRSILGQAISVPAELPTQLGRLREQHRELTELMALAKSRLSLITQWRDQVEIVDEQLQHELVRYADVVAATCIGTATTKLLADQIFDLAIVDEAGQIATPSLLVPLVRSRRAVLVGDHHQLPPFLDDEVSSWAERLTATRHPAFVARVGDLLRRSEFERLYLGTGDANRVMLSVQRRMPEQIAAIASSAFYHGILRTEHVGGPPDPIFRSPLAMIDTSDQPARQRADRPGRSPHGNERRGSVNDLEARLIVSVLRRLIPHYGDWAVIAPYRAQVDLISSLITRELSDIRVGDHVGTVDSFQGGERDLIVYGFTRSNSYGEIGFLKELRRINVAVTRARRQLVLVGDIATLGNARDPGFAELMRSILAQLEAQGDRRPSQEIMAVLRD